jgi:hypothetical protein
MLEESRPWDAALVPPRLLEKPQLLQLQSSRIPAPGAGAGISPENEALQAMMDNLLDQRIPALNDRTPREAAADPSMRDMLLEYMKRHVTATDDLRYRKGLDVDVNHHLEELGLHELIFTPPPLPDIPEDERDHEEDDEEEEDDDADEPPPGWTIEGALAEVPPDERKAWETPAPGRPVLTTREIQKRLDSLDRKYKTAAAAMKWLERDWPELADSIALMSAKELGDNCRLVAALQTTRALGVLFPAGRPRAFELNLRRMAWFLANELESFSQMDDTAGIATSDLEEWSRCSFQPELTSHLCAGIVTLADCSPPALSDAEALDALPVIKAIVRELCMQPVR